ncbi:MAG: zinc ribbon domain-containing protein [Gemmatimonadota bacterium]|nr:zinc ribbon domain-containing protein [Gemmatimonadota bacterium]MDH3571912.1 zinc ribbon domain-containing protein [Gemmatimonadota bacterium]
MPRYDYTCQTCAKPFGVRMSIAEYGDGVTPACPTCGSADVARHFAAVNVLTGSRATGGGAACGPTGFS